MGLKEVLRIVLAYLMQLLIFVLVVISFINKDYIAVLWGVVALIITLIPLMLKKRWNITLPWTLNLLIFIFVFLHFWGFFSD